MFKNSQSLRWVTFTSAHGSLESASFLLPICQPPCHLLQPPHHVHEPRKLHTTKLIICACYEPLLYRSFFLSWVQLLIGMGRRLLQTPEASAYLRAADGTSFNGGLRWELCFCVCFWSCFSLFSFVLGWWVIDCLVTIEYIESISKWVDPVFCRFVLPC